MTFDDSAEVLTITISWQPPGNSEQFDLDNYTVNITSSSGVNISVQVPASTTTRQFTDERKQGAVFSVTVEATNRCEQTGNAVSTTQEYIPSKKCCGVYIYIVVLLLLWPKITPSLYVAYLPML